LCVYSENVYKNYYCVNVKSPVQFFFSFSQASQCPFFRPPQKDPRNFRPSVQKAISAMISLRLLKTHTRRILAKKWIMVQSLLKGKNKNQPFFHDDLATKINSLSLFSKAKFKYYVHTRHCHMMRSTIFVLVYYISSIFYNWNIVWKMNTRVDRQFQTLSAAIL